MADNTAGEEGPRPHHDQGEASINRPGFIIAGQIQDTLYDVENAALGYRVTALVEENKGLASESLFLKRKAAEFARCVLKTREDYRVCMLSQKIEDLHGKIHRLEKGNKESYAKLVQQEEQEKNPKVNLEDCFHARTSGAASLRKCFSFNMKKTVDHNAERRGVAGKKASKLWEKVSLLLLPCRPQPPSSSQQ